MVEPRSFITLPSISHFFLSCRDNSYDTRDRANHLVCGGGDAGEQKGVKTVHSVLDNLMYISSACFSQN